MLRLNVQDSERQFAAELSDRLRPVPACSHGGILVQLCFGVVQIGWIVVVVAGWS